VSHLFTRSTLTDTLAKEIRSIGFTVIFGIDMGGDSISGGIDHPGNAMLGRDMQFKHICSATKIPFYHVVGGPCCDGETTFEDMQIELIKSRALNTMKGCFNMEIMKDVFVQYTANLEESRTPNIVLRAINNTLPVIQDSPHPIFVKVPRNLNPIVPRDWLTRAWVLKYD